jgi:DNA polymerase III epsilon subunit-like protein
MSITRKRLFYDIETSFCEGHFWKPGYNQNILPHQVIKHAQIICISWKWEGEDKIHHADWGINKQCDKALLKKFIKELNKADEIVAHNGDRFDIKWIRTRALYHGIDMRHTYNSIDTLKLAKKYLRLPSNTLASICQYYGLEQKKDPGGIKTWTDIVFAKDKKAMATMLEYCDGDITSLEAVFNKFKSHMPHNLQYAVLRGDEKFHCPECGHLGVWNQTYTTKAGTTSHWMRCRTDDCGKYYKISSKTYQDYIKYKFKNGIK